MAELNISERQGGDVTILDMSGKITIGEGSVALRTAIRRLLESPEGGENRREIGFHLREAAPAYRVRAKRNPR